MLSNLIYCLNAMMPIFILMLTGMLLKHRGFLDDAFAAKLNSFVFRVSLPALLFHDMYSADYRTDWDTAYVLYCFFATLASILLCVLVSYRLRDRDLQGEFIQVSYRSSAALLGIAIAQNLYGTAGMVPLMIIGAVPLYNIAAVAILEFYKPGRGTLSTARLRKTLIGIAKNPLILAILAGLIWSLLRLPMPTIADTSIQYIGRCATPLGILAMGASFDWKKSAGSAKASGLAAFFKLFLLGAIFLPIGIHLGFRSDKLVAALVMCGSPSTVSCFIMAKEMGHHGDLTASTVMITTLLSSFTLTLWLFLFRTHGWI